MYIKQKERGNAGLIFTILIVVLTISIVMYLVYSRKATPAQREEVSGNFNVETLFKHEGCTMYRFQDAGHYRYYSKCDLATSSDTSHAYTESCGKGCTRTVIETVKTKNVLPVAPANLNSDYTNTVPSMK